MVLSKSAKGGFDISPAGDGRSGPLALAGLPPCIRWRSNNLRDATPTEFQLVIGVMEVCAAIC